MRCVAQLRFRNRTFDLAHFISGGGSEGGKSGDGDDNLLQVPSAKRQKKKSGGGGGNASSSPSLEWEAPTIAEEAIDKLTTMFTIYSKCFFA